MPPVTWRPPAETTSGPTLTVIKPVFCTTSRFVGVELVSTSALAVLSVVVPCTVSARVALMAELMAALPAVTVRPPLVIVGPTNKPLVSISVNDLGVMVAAIRSPTTTVRAVVDSWARVIVKVSVLTTVTLTISAFVGSGTEPVGQMVALNGAVGNLVPCPAVTTRLVPDVAGLGAVATAETANAL